MSAIDWIIIAVLTLFVLIVIAAYGRVKYEEGFGIGALCAFYWVDSNTSCNNAAQTYIVVSETHPEDAIYICYRTSNGQFKIPEKAKRLKLDKI